jgi:uncharacterized membrane protein YfcA
MELVNLRAKRDQVVPMIEWSDLPILGVVAAFSAFVGSVAGSGGSTVLLPVLVWYYGVRDAVPILTIANFSANVSRMVINRRDIVFPVVGWFVLGSIPMSVLGAWVFVVADAALLTRLLGALLITVVGWRHLRPRPQIKRATVWFWPVGAVCGFLEGVMGTVGPLMAPFFLAYGLMRNAYIGTDALATVAMQGTKLMVFGSAQVLRPGLIVAGLTLIPFMIAGTVIGKRVLQRVPERVFALLIEGMLVFAGLNFLIYG